MLRLLKLLVLVIMVSSANAVEVTDLYQAKVAVISQIKKDRDQAIKHAMQAVLLKVGGQSSILSNKTIKQGLKNYQQYLIQFSYLKKNGQAQLLASFHEEKINRLFQQANLPLWGNLRPQVLLWLVEEKGLKRVVISESSATQYPQLIDDFSQLRGLPVSLPLMDLTDLESISTADVWGRFAAPIKMASTRYQAETYVVIRLSNSSLLPPADDNSECDLLCRQDNYVVDWRLFTQDQAMEQSSSAQPYQGNDEKALLQQALTDVTQEIYQYYALSTNDSRQIEIEVANVNSMQQYIEVCKFLENLSSVDTVKLTWAQGEKRRFRLHLLGSEKSLLASLRLNKQLQQYIDPLADVIENAIAVFYWKE
ncbi:MAG: hypothetical protein COB35_03380 [Gammaproteobacteria bacterium]|nr:MAG: hypothetical protein COB35_03380 [Gammaproteobacteria bacterium]